MTTRDQVVAHHVNMVLRHTTLTREVFADDVVALYQQRTPAMLRRIDFHVLVCGGDPYKVQRANAQILFRMLEGVTRLPAEVEEAVVLALPEPYRGACLRDLAARYGLMAAPLPAETDVDQAAQLGDLALEFGQAVQALAATMGDGHLTPADAVNARDAVRELGDLIAKASSLRAVHLAIANGAATSAPPVMEKH